MKSEQGNYKKDGFDNQRAIVLPQSIIQKFCLNNKLIHKAFITDIGYYPKAKFHLRTRPQGAEQNILIYCIEGTGQVKIDDKNYNIYPGDFFVIPHGKPHIYETTTTNPWTIYWCHFKGEQADEIVKQIIKKHESYSAKITFTESRFELFNRLYHYLEKGYSFENISYVNLIFLQFLCSFLFEEKFVEHFHETPDNLVDQSIHFMQKNLHQLLTLASLAKEVNSSASHYSNVFKKKTGFPPIEYLNHLKIQKACQFLQFTELRIKEIALKIGFEDQYYFSRLFNKVMGFSPSAYRSSRKSVK